jgi:transcriptional repressor NrdR
VCPFCRAEDSRVIDSRFVRDQHATRRRRLCGACGRRFTTYERVELMLPTVIKRDGRRQAFDVEKIRAGVELACQKRAVSAERIDALIAQVERHFSEAAEREITTKQVGERVLASLRTLDEVAYVRFASVYREFSDVRQFLDELEQLQELAGAE